MATKKGRDIRRKTMREMKNDLFGEINTAGR